MATGQHFNRGTAQLLEFSKKSIECQIVERIAARVGNHGNPAGAQNPAYRVGQRGPAMRHKAGFSFNQIMAKYAGNVWLDAQFNDVTGKMCTGNQVWITDVFQGALKGIGNTDLGQLGGDFMGATFTSGACGVQSCDQLGIGFVNSQTDNMHRLTGPGNRNLDPGNIGHPQFGGRRTGSRNTIDFIMVGKRPNLHPIGLGARGHLGWRERAVREGGVAV